MIELRYTKSERMILMYFNFGDEGGKYLAMLLLGLFALWWLLQKVLGLFGGVLGFWLFVSTVCVVVGIAVSPVLAVFGAVGLVSCLVSIYCIDEKHHAQYYSDRTEKQRHEEEEYGIIDFTDKDE